MDSYEDESELAIKNLLLFTALLEDKEISEKITEIEDILKSGADINAADAENNYDTPLHVAIRTKQKEVVTLLLQWDADITRLNGDDRSALYIARGLRGIDGKEIKDIIDEYAKKKQVMTTDLNPTYANGLNNKQKRTIQRADTIELCRYLKRDGTTGVSGQLYKTKTLGLVLLRASNDKDIIEEKFYLGTNLPETGAFYDICFKYNVKNYKKSYRLFMQCKHIPTEAFMTETDLRNVDGDWSLPNCYDSFLKIMEQFDSDINDPIFGEDFNNVETNFVIYTSSKDKLKKKFYGNTELGSKIHYLINTGDNTAVFRFNYTEEDIDFITKEVGKRRLVSLAYCIIDFMFTDKECKHIMENKFIKTYHVALAQNVLQISTSEEAGFREAVFRKDFFHNNDPFLVLLRETLCKLTLKKYSNKSQFGSEELINLFKQLPNIPSSDEIKMFIGILVNYDEKNNKLKLLNDLSVKGFTKNEIQELTESLEQIHVTANTIKDAVLKAGEDKLSSIRFKVPSCFGNIDMTLNEHDKIFDNIVSVFAYLFSYYRNTKIIELNETNVCKYIKSNGQVVTTEFLQNEGGIGSAIGNLLVLDNETKLLKFNTTTRLPKKANALLQKLKKVLPKTAHLENYRLKIDFHGCPRISFMNNDYDKTLAKYFLGRLWFYTNQKSENKIDEFVKKEINIYYKAHKGPAAFEMCTHIDSIYSTFHDEIQKWWMVTPENRFAPYLSQDSEIFRIAQEGVIDNPLLTLHHQMYLSKMKKIGIEFTSDALMSLQLDANSDRIVNIKTDCDILTAIKIQQHYNNKSNYNFIDFDYMLSLPAHDRHAIVNELKQTTVYTLIVVCGMCKSRTPPNEDLHRIINTFKGNKVIVVTGTGVDSTTKLRIPPIHYVIKDNMNDYLHFTESSQEDFAKHTTLIFQGEQVFLSALLDKTTIKLIDAKLLLKLINNERVEIGHILTNKNYESIQDHYIARCLEKEDSEDPYPVNSLDDIKDQVVVLIAKHGMGKSTLLTHIAVESKKADPTRWIVRINLAEYSNYFYSWQCKMTEINKIDVLKFLCIASLRYIDEKIEFQFIEQDEKIILESCTATEAKVLLELQLFLHYYNERKVTFLFYGFDYICPPFGNETISMLQIIEADGVTIWVTSHYVAMPKKMLENKFGPSYNMQPIDELGQVSFYHKFWKTNIQLEKIHNELFSNIWEFLEYMSGKRDIHEPCKQDRLSLPFISMPLHVLYLMAVSFFQTELSNFSFKHVQQKLKQHLNIDLNRGSTLGSYMDSSPEAKQAAELAGTPLHMYIAANYFQCKIQGRFKIEPDKTEIRKKWDLWRDAVGVYKQFLQHNMNKVCSQSDALDCDEDQETDKRKQFFDKHKKIALLAICKEKHLSMLLPADEIDDLKNTMSRIQTGEEKSAFVDCVFNNVPRFFHIMYAEYCAVELLIDILHNIENDSVDQIKLTHVWDLIVNMVLFTCSNSVRSAFDYKLKHDRRLTEITSSDSCKNIIFEILLKQNSGTPAIVSDGRSPLQAAVDSGMNNLVKLFLMSLDVNLTKENVKSFMKLFTTIDIASCLFNMSGGDNTMPTNVTQFFADMRLDKFVDVVKSDRTIDLILKVLSMFSNSNVVEGARSTLLSTRERLLARVSDRFGLSQDNIDLFRHLAEKIKEHSNS